MTKKTHLPKKSLYIWKAFTQSKS